MTTTPERDWAAPTTSARWTNWGGKTYPVGRIARPSTEEEVAALVKEAVDAGQTVRAAGSGHSYTPIVESDGLLLILSDLTGVLRADRTTQRATVLSGTRIADIGAPLWDAGLALANQGDIDVQTISGAVSTGTKGSGRRLGSLSSTLRGARLVNGLGEVVDVTEDDPDVVHAVQVSLGMLGVLTRLELAVVPRYRLLEEIRVMPFAEVSERWDQLLEDYRHFSFWWCPSATSGSLYELELYGHGEIPPDHCVVKLLRDAGPDEETTAPRTRVDRSHRIYPDGTTDVIFHELEYVVDERDVREAVEVLRRLQLDRFTDEISPLQVRWQQADEGFLSPQYRRNGVSLSVSGVPGTDYEPFLRTVDRELQAFDARPHWGKINYLTPERVRALYPRFEDFQTVRRRFDPHDRFLNTSLGELFRD